MERARRQPRPVRDHTTARHGAADQKRRRAGAVIRASRAIGRRGAAEFRRNEHRCLSPHGTELFLQGSQAGVERAESHGELALRAAFVRMRVPARGVEHGDLRARPRARKPAAARMTSA